MTHTDGTSSSKVKQWFDGLGRVLETMDMGAGTSGNNLVTFTEYDNAGRVSKQWLPYAVGHSRTMCCRPYAETQYEASTLGRTMKEYGPGSAWATHPKTTEYLSNTASGVLACKVYGVSTANALTGGSGYYAAGQLFVTKAADMGALDALRSSLSSAHVTTYTHSPLIGVTSITKPNREKKTYTYDSKGRPAAVKEHSGYTEEQYDYNYQQ